MSKAHFYGRVAAEENFSDRFCELLPGFVTFLTPILMSYDPYTFTYLSYTSTY